MTEKSIYCYLDDHFIHIYLGHHLIQERMHTVTFASLKGQVTHQQFGTDQEDPLAMVVCGEATTVVSVASVGVAVAVKETTIGNKSVEGMTIGGTSLGTAGTRVGLGLFPDKWRSTSALPSQGSVDMAAAGTWSALSLVIASLDMKRFVYLQVWKYKKLNNLIIESSNLVIYFLSGLKEPYMCGCKRVRDSRRCLWSWRVPQY